MSWQPAAGPKVGLRNSSYSLKSGENYWDSLKTAITGKEDSLPLYKDKPTSFKARIASGTNTRRKLMLYKGSAILIAFYVCYYIGCFLRKEVFPEQFTDKEIDWSQAQLRVKQAFKDSWASYEKNGWGYDEYKPVSEKGKNMGPKPLGWIIVDSLDTLLIMDLKEQYRVAESWVANELSYDFDYDVNVFETTIRMLGGLLSAYYLSNNDMYLEKAAKLGDTILGSFESSSGLPYSSVNLKTGKGKRNHDNGGASSTAEVSTLQLEFKYLSKLTGESLYWEKVEKIMSVLDDNHPKDGLVPIYVHPDTGKYQGDLIRLGSRGDSYYEYLLKQYLQTVEREPVYLTMYKESIKGMKDHLLRYSKPNNLAFFGELEHGLNGAFSNKMDHLVCFMGGLLALGATEGKTLEEARKSSDWDSIKEQDFLLAKEITHTCYRMYADTETGLAPEIVVFNTNENSKADFNIKPADTHNLQRPETVESLFVLYRITKDPIYRKWGWEIFKSFEKYTKLPDGGYSSLKDVTKLPPQFRDNMESFWLAETLKYLYLLFDDSKEEILPLDKVVFNTEAHPFPIFEMNPLFKTGWKRNENIKADESINTRGNLNEKIDEELGSNIKEKMTKLKEKNASKHPPVETKPFDPGHPTIQDDGDELAQASSKYEEDLLKKKLSTEKLAKLDNEELVEKIEAELLKDKEIIDNEKQDYEVKISTKNTRKTVIEDEKQTEKKSNPDSIPAAAKPAKPALEELQDEIIANGLEQGEQKVLNSEEAEELLEELINQGEE